MAGDFNKPVVTDAYASVLQSIKDLISDLAKGLDGTSTANIPTNAIRWSSANNRFEKYNGSTWAALASTFAMNVASVAGKIPGLAANNLLYLDGNAKVPLANMYTGSGSGLNADQLDGVDISNIFRNQGDVTAANDTTATGFGVYRRTHTSSTDTILSFNVGGSTGPVQLSFHYGGEVNYRNQTDSTNWQAWRRFLTSANAPGAFNAQAAGTYGGMNITGAKGGWAGFQFNSTSRYFMSSGGQTGEYDTGASAWQWRWDNGTLSYGTVPWARLSGVPAMSFLALTGGSVSGAITSTVAGENNVFVSSGDIGGDSVNWNANRRPALQVDAASNTSAYMIWRATKLGGRHLAAMDAYAGGSSSSTVRVDLHVGSTNTFQFHGTGQIYTANYGWLHDYFFNNVANCGGEGTGSPAVNCYGSGSVVTGYRHELINNGGQLQIRTVNYLSKYNCNCNCTCFPAGSKVLMFDKSWRDIETIVIGELLMGADGKPAEVVKLDTPILGERQMYTFDDGHTWSEEHLHWIRRDGAEWWWSANPDQWRYEVQVGEVAGLRDNMSVRSGEDVEFAHLEGFVKRTPTRVQYDPSTPLFLPVTRGIPIIVDGYVVAASADEFSYDYSQFNWNPREIV